MRRVPDVMKARWHSGEYIGDAKPMARVTVQRPQMKLVRTPENLFSTLPFGGGTVPKELPNVKSVSWNRDIDSDVATCSIEFYNTEPLPLGEVPQENELDRPGWYSYNRGTTAYSRRWGHEPNEWRNMLMPDNVIKTFEGYGFDSDSIPEKDPNLVQTGVWMIDEVSITSEGMISVECRDLGRLLIDQIAFPPVVPFKAGFVTDDLPDGAYSYPVEFQGFNDEPVTNSVTQSAQRLDFSYRTSSNAPYSGSGPVHGHYPRDAFDGDDSSYWMSVGNARPDQGYSFEWIEGTVKSQRVRRVRFKSKWKGHTAYLCLYVEGKGWIGSNTVPYNPNHPASAPNGANTKYHSAKAVTTTGWTEFNLGDGVGKVKRVRITFGGLANSKVGTYPYRAGMRRFEVFGGARTRKEVTTFSNKNYDDYCADEQTEIMTKRGWLRWDEVRIGDESLAIDPSTGIANWQVIESVYRKHWDARPMISMESQLHSSLTTPDHRWLVTDQAGRRHWRTTETLRTGHRIPMAAPVELPVAAKYGDDFVELVAWFWTEGWVSGEHGNACIAQSETANPIHTARIRAALTRLFGAPGRMVRGRGAMWNESQRVDGVVTFRLSKPVKDDLLEVAPDKVVTPSFLTSLTAAQLELFIERSIDADGWRTTKGRVGLSQRDERRARSFEMALVLAGRPSRTRQSTDGMWQVNLLRHAVTMPQSAQVEEVAYSGHVWCPTLKHSNWLARRNGSVYFTGNTDIVKLFCAWAGFYWPRAIVHMVGDAGLDEDYMASYALVLQRIADIRANRDLPPDPDSDVIWADRVWSGGYTIGEARTAIDMHALEYHGQNTGAEIILSDGSKDYFKYTRVNPSTGDDRTLTIRVGRVWGDFQKSGTAGPAPLTADIFDKKPLMDGIAYVRDILGFLFFIDEFGSVVFKMQNIYSVGNTIRSLGVDSGERTTEMVSLDERQVVQNVEAKVTSRNIRERTFVADTTGEIGHMAAGWNPNPIGLRRVGGWTDQNFETANECLRMAEMIALRQLFTYRTNSVTIPGYPAIQIDDQVRVYERVTSEGYIHYIKGVNSSLDLEAGEYSYTLDTHWLGERPFKKWAFDPKKLSRETQQYLNGLFV